MKKVLYVSPNGYLGGAERFVLTAVKAHAERNNIDASILFYSDGEACDEARLAGLKVHILKQSFRFRYPWKLISALLEIRKMVKEINPDILHLTMPYSHISISLATMGLKIKKVWFQHGPVGGKLDMLANIFPVDVIIYNSLDVQKRHRETWPASKVKLKEIVINYGVHIPKSTHLILDQQKIRLGTAGRICSWKGFHNILTALGELKEEFQLKPFDLKIAGAVKMSSDKEYQESLIKIRDKYNLNNEVHFLNHQKDMESYYNSIDIFIHASVIPEPFGLVVAEAMINNCFVIASNSGGVADLMKNGKNGYSFSATTDNAVVELKEILKTFLVLDNNFSHEKYQQMAESAKQFVIDNYSIDQMCNQLESLYLEMTN